MCSLSSSNDPDKRKLWIIHHQEPSGSRLWMSSEDERTFILLSLSLIGCWHDGSGGSRQGSCGGSLFVIIDFLKIVVSLIKHHETHILQLLFERKTFNKRKENPSRNSNNLNPFLDRLQLYKHPKKHLDVISRWLMTWCFYAFCICCFIW